MSKLQIPSLDRDETIVLKFLVESAAFPTRFDQLAGDFIDDIHKAEGFEFGVNYHQRYQGALERLGEKMRRVELPLAKDK